MKIRSLIDLLTLELQDLYSCEQQILEAAPKMMEASTDKTLKKAFKDHIKETEQQAKRLEKIAKSMGIDPEGKPCDGMKGIIKEGEEIVKADMPKALKDLGISSGAQKVEHYEMVGYKSAIAMAKQLKLQDVVDLLKETYDEEEKSDKLLLQIAKNDITPAVKAEEG